MSYVPDSIFYRIPDYTGFPKSCRNSGFPEFPNARCIVCCCLERSSRRCWIFPAITSAAIAPPGTLRGPASTSASRCASNAPAYTGTNKLFRPRQHFIFERIFMFAKIGNQTLYTMQNCRLTFCMQHCIYSCIYSIYNIFLICFHLHMACHHLCIIIIIIFMILLLENYYFN